MVVIHVAKNYYCKYSGQPCFVDIFYTNRDRAVAESYGSQEISVFAMSWRYTLEGA